VRPAGRPFSFQPGSTERAVYRGFSQKRKLNKLAHKSGRTWSQIAALQEISELYREIRTLAQQAGGLAILLASPADAFKSLEQPVEVLRQELLAENRIGARPREFVLGDQIAHGLAIGL
jgi:hypothetical protein